MLGAAVVLFRLAQFGAAAILFGSSLFLIYALPRQGLGSGADLGWPRRLLGWSAAALLAASVLGLLAQTSVLAGSVAEGMKPDSLTAVMTTMAIGPSSLVRALAGGLAVLATTFLRPGRPLFLVAALLGAAANATFAWMGHGAATQGAGGALHLVADVLHALAASIWIGALVMFAAVLRDARRDPALERTLHAALHGFAGVGSALVAVLVATGLVNSWFLVGPSRVAGLWTTPYGQLLSLKLLAFVGMLALATANRFQLTPALKEAHDADRASTGALAALRRSLAVETLLAFVVLALVAWLGTLAPASAA